MVSLSTQNSQTVNYVVVEAEMVGQRLDNFLMTHLKGLPRTRIYRIIRKGEIRVNKGRVGPDYRIVQGDSIRIPPLRIAVDTKAPTPPAKMHQALLSAILYEDEDLIVLNKPAGMAVHGGSGVSLGVIEALRALRPEIRSLELVHRLDRDTSGCLMIAKRRALLKVLHAFLREGQIEKIYWTLVKGHWQRDRGVDVPLHKNQLSSGERMVRVDPVLGQSAYTEFKVLKTYAQSTLLEVRPLTGRTHQIRVHAAYAGHPIAGDIKYGESGFNRAMKRLGLNRLFLHARKISIPWPTRHTPLTIEAPLAHPLTQILEHLHLSGDIQYV